MGTHGEGGRLSTSQKKKGASVVGCLPGGRSNVWQRMEREMRWGKEGVWV